VTDVYGQLVINTISCAPTFAQVGRVEALVAAAGRRRRDGRGVQGARDLIVDGSIRIPGSTAARPVGAFYAFPDISGTGCPAALSSPSGC
jgi:aspartate/methionine/tyrosine aminotransferase